MSDNAYECEDKNISYRMLSEKNNQEIELTGNIYFYGEKIDLASTDKCRITINQLNCKVAIGYISADLIINSSGPRIR